jgi:hypothetical protein
VRLWGRLQQAPQNSQPASRWERSNAGPMVVNLPRCEAPGTVEAHLAADPHAPSAEHAEVVVAVVKWIVLFNGKVVVKHRVRDSAGRPSPRRPAVHSAGHSSSNGNQCHSHLANGPMYFLHSAAWSQRQLRVFAQQDSTSCLRIFISAVSVRMTIRLPPAWYDVEASIRPLQQRTTGMPIRTEMRQRAERGADPVVAGFQHRLVWTDRHLLVVDGYETSFLWS